MDDFALLRASRSCKLTIFERFGVAKRNATGAYYTNKAFLGKQTWDF